jgi:hypothetical protein
MNEARATPEAVLLRPLRARLRAAGVVAQYIHELSDRHARARQPSPAIAGQPSVGRGADTADSR